MVHYAQSRRRTQNVKEAAPKGHPFAVNHGCRFVLAASEAAHFPTGRLPEVAFIGRSNAGKSTLINALTGQKKLARFSKTPGRTQQIVFFNASDRLMLVDLPGYGHAQASKKERAAWSHLIAEYLEKRAPLRCVFLLADSRHGLKANDVAMMERLDAAGINYQVLLAKADYLKPDQRESLRKDTEAALNRHPAARPNVMAVSSKKSDGIEDLRGLLAAFAATRPKSASTLKKPTRTAKKKRT